MKLDGEKIIRELDLLFSKNEVEKAGAYLYENLKLSREYGDSAAEITVLNELIGYHRRTGNEKEAIKLVNEAVKLTENRFFGGITAANTYLNSATTLKCFNKASEALPLYKKAYGLYLENISEGDYRFAGFFNNYGLALTDTGNFDGAEKAFEKALYVLSLTGENFSEIAVTYCNTAFLYDKQNRGDKVNACLDNAFAALNDERNVRDGYYAFNCEKCANAFKYFGRFFEQWELEERANGIYAHNRGE